MKNYDLNGRVNSIDQNNLRIPNCLPSRHESQKGGVGLTDESSLNTLRVSQDFAKLSGVKTHRSSVEIRKPNKQEFVRVRAGDEWQLHVAVINDEKEQKLWLITNDIASKMQEDVSFMLLRLAINRDGVSFLWPLKISRNGRFNSWNQSAMVAANKAVDYWVRLQSNLRTKQYEIKIATATDREPAWPEMTFEELIDSIPKDQVIDNFNHPFLKQLRGEL